MKILFLRRFTQLAIMALFIISNYYGFKLLNGNLSASVVLDKVHLSDPFALIQLILAGASVSFNAILGAILVGAFYALIASRAFCSWVCPINLFTDMAAKLRVKFGFKNDKALLNLSRNTRYYLLALSLILSLLLGLSAFESVSFVGLTQRGIIYLDSFVLAVIFIIIIFDMFILPRGICGHICPLGAFYALLSKFSLIRVTHNVQKCTKCGECLKVCPEVKVLEMIGKRSDYVRDSSCVSCGQCIDICKDSALKFNIRNLKEKR